MKNIFIFHCGVENIATIDDSLESQYGLKFFSYVNLIKEEYHLKTELGLRTYEYIREQYLPETEVDFELIESYFQRSTDVGMVFTSFWSIEYFSKFVELHKTYNHSLYIIHFYETFEQSYTSAWDGIKNNPQVQAIPNYQETVRRQVQSRHDSIQMTMNLTKDHPYNLVLDAHLPVEEHWAKIKAFYES